MQKAMYYEKTNDNAVKCLLCPHGCVLRPDQTGICMARKNFDGELYSENYGIVTSISLDPIEKKPLKRFHPGSYILSVGSYGCNLKCSFCQNWNISQNKPQSENLLPEELIDIAQRTIDQGNIGIAFTYNEPSIWYEFVYNTAKLAHEKGLLNILVTNGYISLEPMKNLLPYIDAMNIDLKAMTDEFYKEICRGHINYVKEIIDLCAKSCHVEITTLLIPGYNDSEKEIEELSKWIASISSDIPLHLTRYFPNYKLTEPKEMDRERLIKLSQIAKKNLKYVYLGNV